MSEQDDAVAEARMDERVRAAALVLTKARSAIPFTIEGHEKFLTDLAKEILAGNSGAERA